MRITIANYNSEWINQFENIKAELSLLLASFQPQIEHFGSTSVPGLAAKPVIDILVGIQDINQFDSLVKNILTHDRYIYYKAFNAFIPNRRLFVRLKNESNTEDFGQTFSDLKTIPHEKINAHRIAHVHVWEYQSDNWIRHIAFREYLKTHDEVRSKYQELKQQLSQQLWQNGMEYNDGKNQFIKQEEQKAIAWYLKQKENP